MKMNKGNALVEVVVALTVATTVISAIVSVTILAQSNTLKSSAQNQATQYAQEAMEITRRLRDTSWTAFTTKAGTGTPNIFCLEKGSTQLRGPVTGSLQTACFDEELGIPAQNVDDIYIRTVTLQSNSSTCAISSATKVVASVLWSDGKCTDANNQYCHAVELISCLTDYYVIPTP
jgi:hypothetical protein